MSAPTTVEPGWAALAETAEQVCRQLLEAESARTGRSVEDLEREALDQVHRHLDAWIAAEEAGRR